MNAFVYDSDIKAIKDNEIVPKLKREFLERKRNIGK